MPESLTDRTGPRSRGGSAEARFGVESLMQDKASHLSKMAFRHKTRICGAYPATGYGRINVFGHSQNKI